MACPFSDGAEDDDDDPVFSRGGGGREGALDTFSEVMPRPYDSCRW
jgi:hypothetical protein